MFENLASQLIALGQVLMIDLVLAGDNAVAVGLAAAGLAEKDRKKAILYGLIAAVAMRIGFALITAQLLGIIGLLFAGGILLLWVCWKMWREMRDQAKHDEEVAGAAMDADPSNDPPVRETKTFGAGWTDERWEIVATRSGYGPAQSPIELPIDSGSRRLLIELEHGGQGDVNTPPAARNLYDEAAQHDPTIKPRKDG